MTVTDLRFTEHESGWSLYELDDGTIVRMRVIMVKAKRRPDGQGDMLYDITPHLIVDIESPCTMGMKQPTQPISGTVQ